MRAMKRAAADVHDARHQPLLLPCGPHHPDAGVGKVVLHVNSWIGTLSTTDQTSPAASIIALRCKISSTGHTSPFGM
ncbi:hypothetical protein E05_14080 [Plautia stali symbiont]|nr:hypothetical protein E05_14080 [Plautia stali symbiont]